jgi:hypothetical protein
MGRAAKTWQVCAALAQRRLVLGRHLPLLLGREVTAEHHQTERVEMGELLHAERRAGCQQRHQTELASSARLSLARSIYT